MRIINIKKLLFLVYFFAILFLMISCSSPIVENYTISASCNAGGVISPIGEVSILPGEDQSFTITPNTGYQIGDVQVDGDSVGVVTSYAFNNVNQDHIIMVTFLGTGPVHNLTKETYYETIQTALDDADSNDTIEVNDGTYNESIIFPYDKKIILRSIHGNPLTFIYGDADSPTVKLLKSLAGTTLKGFTISHKSENSGKGIELNNSHLNIDDCSINGNTSNDYGGGIKNFDSTLIISNSHICSNITTPGSGGGIHSYNSILSITKSIITGNYADDGAGIQNGGNNTVTISDSNISGNTASLYGGGINNYNNSLGLTITDSIISGNVACYGAGIYAFNSTFTVEDTDIYGNKSNQSGGGIYLKESALTLTGSTVSDNSAETGGGIMVWSISSAALSIGGSGPAKKNVICGNYKIGNSPSLEEQIKEYFSGSLYDSFRFTNYISASCVL